MKIKNSKFIALSILISFCLFNGISFAYWRVVNVQSDYNQVIAKCFKTDFVENSSGIDLQDTFPISDEEGKLLKPYSFTITNLCDSFAAYQINLDILDETTLDLQYIKSSLNNDNINLLSSFDEVDKTIQGSIKTLKLKTGGLENNQSLTFNFRLWMDQDTTLEDGIGKNFESKISVITLPISKKKYCEQNIDLACPGTIKEIESISSEDDLFLEGPIKRSEVNSIEFLPHMNIPEDVNHFWDVSVTSNKGVMAWATKNDKGYYDVKIGSTDEVLANEDSSYLFAYLGTEIDNFTLKLNNLNTSSVTNMSEMFSNTRIADSSYKFDIDTSNVINMSYMFHSFGKEVKNLAIDLSAFDTSKVTSAFGMFFDYGNGSTNLKLNLNSFDFSNLIDATHMFYTFASQVENVELQIDQINMPKVHNAGFMFAQAGRSSTNFVLNIGSMTSFGSWSPETMGIFIEAGESNPNFYINMKSLDLDYMNAFYIAYGISTPAKVFVKNSEIKIYIEESEKEDLIVVDCSTEVCP